MMNKMSIAMVLLGVVFLMGMTGCASKRAAMQSTSAGSSVSSAATELPSVLPATAVAASVGPSDSLKACLAKISNDASDGARMVAEQSCQDNEKLHQGVIGTAIAKSGNRASAGTQGDSLKVCIAGIPIDATSGQRMLAEESCKRDQLTHH